MKKLLIGTACVLASSSLMAAAMPANRAPTGPHGWYVGGGINHSATMSETQSSNNAVTATGNRYMKNSYPGYDIFAGYRLTNYFGIEAMFSNFGERRYVNSVARSNTVLGTHSTRAAYANGFAYLPLYGNMVEGFINAGPNYYYQQGGNVVTAATAYDGHAKISTFGINFGGGVLMNWNMFGQGFGARATYNNYEALTATSTKTTMDPDNVVALDLLWYVPYFG